MSILVTNLKLPLDAAFSTLAIHVSAAIGAPESAVRGVRVVRKSLDARKKQHICWNVHAVVQLDAQWQRRVLKQGLKNVSPAAPPLPYRFPQAKEGAGGRILVVGLGPAGLFAAYYLSKFGYRPLVVERGGPWKSGQRM